MPAQSSVSPARNAFTVDVEDWFHILDSPAVPPMERWPSLESRIERNVNSLLAMLEETNVRATFFWLGWVAEQHKALVRQCADRGHEIASHGYAHLLAFRVGREAFHRDTVRSRELLEDLTGRRVRGYRAAGFGITEKAPWAFDVIREAGFDYDSSIFPASRGHGGLRKSQLGLHTLDTAAGPLVEVPMSAVQIMGRRISMFGGGYLRCFPLGVIHWGATRLHSAGYPLIVYMHPREIDPEHPRLALSPMRRFKSYFNLASTMPKIRSLCATYRFCTLSKMVDEFVREQRSAGS